MRKVFMGMVVALSTLWSTSTSQRADAAGFILLVKHVSLTPCSSTGVLDFSNTCNDIYYFVGLQ